MKYPPSEYAEEVGLSPVQYEAFKHLAQFLEVGGEEDLQKAVDAIEELINLRRRGVLAVGTNLHKELPSKFFNINKIRGPHQVAIHALLETSHDDHLIDVLDLIDDLDKHQYGRRSTLVIPAIRKRVNK